MCKVDGRMGVYLLYSLMGFGVLWFWCFGLSRFRGFRENGLGFSRQGT